MILHILPDSVFSDMAIKMFMSVGEEETEFIQVSSCQKLKYASSKNIKIITPLSFISKRFSSTLLKYEAVFIHSLDILGKHLIYNAHPSVNFIWIGWGYDYYEYIKKDLFGDETYKLKLILEKKTPFSLKKCIYSAIKRCLIKTPKEPSKIFDKINYFAPVLKTEYDLIKKSIQNFKPHYIDWNYGNLEDDLIPHHEIKENKKNCILIGNSASFTNNHLEVFSLIQKKNINNTDILCPLSYGDPLYKNFISKKGNELFQEKFHPILDFMPIHEYNTLISTCAVAIMGHYRQQALGNIYTLMFSGTKIFLSEQNPIYTFFKEKGAFIYTLNDISQESISSPLNQTQINNNRAILIQHIGKKAMQNKTRILLSTCLKKTHE